MDVNKTIDKPLVQSSRCSAGWFQKSSAVAFPVVLWLASTFFFCGRLGKYLDDYCLSVREPATGRYDLPLRIWEDWPFFYRPLHLMLVHYAQTLLWNHDWANHLINAGVHGVVTLLFWRLLRLVARSPHIAAVGAIIFLVFPLNYEVVYWPAAVSTGISAGVFLLLAIFYLVFGRNGWHWSRIILLMLLAFLIPCWNEQAATGIVALPFLYLAISPSGGQWKRRLVRCITPVVACCLACLLYIVLVHASAPPGLRGSAGSLVGMGELTGRLSYVSSSVKAKMFGPWIAEIFKGGLITGWQVLRQPVCWIWFLLILVTALYWLIYWFKRNLDDEKSTHVSKPFLGLAFGLAVFLAAWLPVIMVRSQIIEARVCYFPLLGLVFAGAILLDLIVTRLAFSRISAFLLKTGLTMGAIVVALACCMSLIGVQAVYRQRYLLDQKEMAQLKILVPQPDAGTIFTPLDIKDIPARTGYYCFDHFAIGALGTPWSAKAIIQQTYKRKDVLSTAFLWWLPLPLHYIDKENAGYDHELDCSLFKRTPDGILIRWAQMVPFIVDADGGVHLVDTICVERLNNDDVEIQLPHIRKRLTELQLPVRSFSLQDRRCLENVEPLTGWRWLKTGKPVDFHKLAFSGIVYDATTMHPVYMGEQTRSAMVTSLPPSPVPYRLHFRAQLAEYAPDQGPGDGVGIIWYLSDERDNPLATCNLATSNQTQERQWVPVTIDMLAHDRDLELHLEVEPGPMGDTSYDTTMVTIGYRQAVTPNGR